MSILIFLILTSCVYSAKRTMTPEEETIMEASNIAKETLNKPPYELMHVAEMIESGEMDHAEKKMILSAVIQAFKINHPEIFGQEFDYK